VNLPLVPEYKRKLKKKRMFEITIDHDQMNKNTLKILNTYILNSYSWTEKKQKFLMRKQKKA